MIGRKKKKQTQHKIIDTGRIFLFVTYGHDREWYFLGDFDTTQDAEKEMIVTGEPEHVEYKVIRGQELATREGIASFPTVIEREDEN